MNMSQKDLIGLINFIFYRYAAGNTPTEQQIKYAIEDWSKHDIG